MDCFTQATKMAAMHSLPVHKKYWGFWAENHTFFNMTFIPKQTESLENS